MLILTDATVPSIPHKLLESSFVKPPGLSNHDNSPGGLATASEERKEHPFSESDVDLVLV